MYSEGETAILITFLYTYTYARKQRGECSLSRAGKITRTLMIIPLYHNTNSLFESRLQIFYDRSLRA